jgi:hypothetical protein
MPQGSSEILKITTPTSSPATTRGVRLSYWKRGQECELDVRVGRDRSPWRVRKIRNQTRVEITACRVDLLPW